jgi:outer membrane protein assembly factor BamD (BamD/ComL family)
MRIADYHYQDKDYPEAVKAYDRYLEVFANSEGAARAMLQAARASHLSFRGLDQDETPLLEARERYQMFAERFPVQADRANVAATLEQIRLTLAHKMYAIGEFYERTHQRRAAKFYYRLVMKEYPQTPWYRAAGAALRRLGENPSAATQPAVAASAEPDADATGTGPEAATQPTAAAAPEPRYRNLTEVE